MPAAITSCTAAGAFTGAIANRLAVSVPWLVSAVIPLSPSWWRIAVSDVGWGNPSCPAEDTLTLATRGAPAPEPEPEIAPALPVLAPATGSTAWGWARGAAGAPAR